MAMARSPCYCGESICSGFMGEKAFYDSRRRGNVHGIGGRRKAKEMRAKQARPPPSQVKVLLDALSTHAPSTHLQPTPCTANEPLARCVR